MEKTEHQQEERGQTGPQSYFRPKDTPGVSVTLTKLGKGILNAASRRTSRTRSDVVEQLLRKYGATVTFDEQPPDGD